MRNTQIVHNDQNAAPTLGKCGGGAEFCSSTILQLALRGVDAFLEGLTQ
jgi:hypothetical protein